MAYGIRWSETLITAGAGVVGLIGYFRLKERMAAASVKIIAGPDSYLAAISLVLLLCGAVAAVGSFRQGPDRTPSEGHLLRSARVIVVLGTLFGYLGAVQILGYLAGSLIFLPLLFCVFGMRPLYKSVLTGMAMAGGFYLLFEKLAQIFLPKGWIGL